jgi:hypothetical protein
VDLSLIYADIYIYIYIYIYIGVEGFLDFMTSIDAEHRIEASVSSSKFKGSREVKNLECSINYDARGLGSSRGKAKRTIAMY